MAKKLCALFLAATLAAPIPPSDKTVFSAKSVFLAPVSSPQKETQANPLTAYQEEVLREVFLNSELNVVLEDIKNRILTSLNLRIEENVEALSRRSKQASKGRKNKRKKKKFSMAAQVQKRSQLLDQLVTEYLLREIWGREITYRKRLRLEGTQSGEINRRLEEFRRVMPTEGIRFYLVKGVYVLAYKEFLIVLHEKHRDIAEIGAFSKILQKRELSLENGRRPTDKNWRLRVFHLSSAQRAELCAALPVDEFEDAPSPEKMESLGRLSAMVDHVQPILQSVETCVARLQLWAAQEESSASVEESSEEEPLQQTLLRWKNQLATLRGEARSLLRMRESGYAEVMLKRSKAIDILARARDLSEEIIGEIINEDRGRLFLAGEDKSFLEVSFDMAAVGRDAGTEPPRERLVRLINDLDSQALEIAGKIGQLEKIDEPRECDLLEIVKNVAGDCRRNPSLKGVEFECAGEKGTAIGTLPLRLEIVMAKIVAALAAGAHSKTGVSLGKIRFQVSGGSAASHRIEIIPFFRRGETPLDPPETDALLSARFANGSEASSGFGSGLERLGAALAARDGAVALEMRRSISSGKRERVRLHAIRGTNAAPAVREGQFFHALKKYKRIPVDSFLPEELRRELRHLNEAAGLTVAQAAEKSARAPDAVLALFGVEEAATLRDIADQTGLRVSEIAQRLGIPNTTESSWVDCVDNRSEEIGRAPRHRQVAALNRFLDKNLKGSDERLVALRLFINDPSGDLVEQILVDRASRIRRFADTLGTPASFDKFLFNAARVFSRNSLDIAFNDIYVDPRSRGFGFRFNQAQLAALNRSGFSGVRKKEDCVSLATMLWQSDAEIDWQKLAFKEHWLRLMRELFEVLAIPVRSGALTTENLKEDLNEAKSNSSSFEDFLKLKFEGMDSEEVIKRVNELRRSREKGAFEFLLFRLVGYGFRMMHLEKLRAALEALPDSVAEKGTGLKILEDGQKGFWEKIDEARGRLEEGERRAGIEKSLYPPDFSKDSPDKLKAFRHTEDLLQKHEFLLSVVGVIGEASHPEKHHPHLKLGNYYEILERMRPRLSEKGETAAPQFLPDFGKRYDRETSRYQDFWNRKWKKPQEAALAAARRFHDAVSRERNDDPNLFQGRIYYPDLAELFFRLPEVRKLLDKKDGYAGAAETFKALFYHNPQLAGIVLRSSRGHLAPMRLILSELDDEIIAKMLDLEIVSVPKAKLKRFEEIDGFTLLHLLEPNKAYHPEYGKRVRKLSMRVKPETFACILQQAHHLSTAHQGEDDPVRGLIESVFLLSLREMKDDIHLRDALDILERKWKDREAVRWIHDFYDREAKRTEPESLGDFIGRCREKLRQGSFTRFLFREGLPPQPHNEFVYGAFMNNFGGFWGFSDMAAQTLSSLLREDAEVAAAIVRSTVKAQHHYLYEVLRKMDEEDVAALFNHDLRPMNHPEEADFKNVGGVNEFVYWVLLVSFLGDVEMKSKKFISHLSPEAIAALIQFLRHKDGDRDLERLLELLQQADQLKRAEALELLAEGDPQTAEWVEWIVKSGTKTYSEDFFRGLREEHGEWLDSRNPAARWRRFAELLEPEIRTALRKSAVRQIRRHFKHEESAEFLFFLQDVERLVQSFSFSENLREKLFHLAVSSESLAQTGLREEVIRLLRSDAFEENVKEDGLARAYFLGVVPLMEMLASHLESGDPSKSNAILLACGRLKSAMDQVRRRISRKYPGEKIAAAPRGYHAPFVFNLMEEEMKKMCAEIFERQGARGFKGGRAGKAIFRARVIGGDPMKNLKKFYEVDAAALEGVVAENYPKYNPDTMPRPAAIVAGQVASGNSHEEELAKAKKIPLAYLEAAESLLAPFDGRVCVLEVSADLEGALRLATAEEVAGFEEAVRRGAAQTQEPPKLAIPETDLDEGEPLILTLARSEEESGFIVPHRDRGRVGYKADRLAKLRQSSEPVYLVPDGFSVTFKAYEEFLRHNRTPEGHIFEEEISNFLKLMELEEKLRDAAKKLKQEGGIVEEAIRSGLNKLLAEGTVPRIFSADKLRELPGELGRKVAEIVSLSGEVRFPEGMRRRLAAVLEDETVSFRDEILTRIQFLFREGSGVFPGDLKQQLARRLESFPEGTHFYARSSSNVEDLPDYSGAGTLRTCKDVPRDLNEMEKSIRAVWCSVWEADSFYNRSQYGIRGQEHLKAKVSVLVQKAVPAAYSGLIESHFEGNPDKIRITIGRGAGKGVDDGNGGEHAADIIYDGAAKTIERREHPYLWNDRAVGVAEWVAAVREERPEATDPQIREYLEEVKKRAIVLTAWLNSVQIGIDPSGNILSFQDALTVLKALVETDDANKIKEAYEKVVPKNISLREMKINSAAKSRLKLKQETNLTKERLFGEESELIPFSWVQLLCEINARQRAELFDKLLETARNIEKTFPLFRVLVEFAVEGEGRGAAVVPLQVKGVEGARSLSFLIRVLNGQGVHALTSGLLVKSLADLNWEGQRIYFRKIEDELVLDMASSFEKGNGGVAQDLFAKLQADSNAGGKNRKRLEKNTFSFMSVAGSNQGDLFEVIVTGRGDLTATARRFRETFVNYCGEGTMREINRERDPESQLPYEDYPIGEEGILRIFGFYVDDGNYSKPIPISTDEREKLRLIYRSNYPPDAGVQLPPAGLEAAI